MPHRDFTRTPPKILFQNQGSLGSGTYRMLLPASLLRKHGFAVTQAHEHNVAAEPLEILDPDTIVFQLYQTQPQQERIKAYRKATRHAFFVYEIDDLFWGVPETSWHKNNPLLLHAKSNIRTAAKLCDAITCTTPQLAEEMSKLTGMKDVRVVPNNVPRAFVNAALAGRRSSNAMKSPRPRVGWAGGIGHAGDLAILMDTIRRFGNKVQWVFAGVDPANARQNPNILPSDLLELPNVELHGGVPYNDYGEFLGRLNLDVALAPLADNSFNQCKSDLRVLEYAAAGYPVIASDIGTYKKCPVTFCTNTPEAWYDAINNMLQDSAREARGEELHEWLLAKRIMENHLSKQVEAYLPKSATAFYPNVNRQAVGGVVTVSQIGPLLGLPNHSTFEDAWKAAPGADVLYVRAGTSLNEAQIARTIQSLNQNASATPLTNDCGYPSATQFQQLPEDLARKVDIAANLANTDPIECPYPSGPCTILSGVALARLGLPDEKRFGNIEYAMADWGARASETGLKNVLVANTYVHTTSRLSQAHVLAKKTLEHIAMWCPAFVAATQVYQGGEALATVREDIELAYHAMYHTAPEVADYNSWSRTFFAVTESDRQAMTEDAHTWATRPTVNIVLPVYDPNIDHLKACLDSVLDQVYPHWRLCVCNDASTNPEVGRLLKDYLNRDQRVFMVTRHKNGHICAASNDALKLAEGEWVVFLDHDDTLAPQALWLVAQEAIQYPETQFIYTDSDKITPDGDYTDAYFGPDFSYELLLAQNYVTHLCAYRLDKVREIGGLREGLEGSQDWDLVLRYLEATCGNPPNEQLIRHISQVAYHWRMHPDSTSANIMAKPYALTAGRQAVTEHIHRTGQTTFIAPNPVLPIFLMLRFLVPDPAPKVTMIIPTADNLAQLNRCVESLVTRTVYSNFNVAVIDTGVGQRIKNIWGDKVQILRTHSVPFNYARLNNEAVDRAEDAEFICFLNDDTEIFEPGWLHDMVGMALREKVGAVGAKLLYPDGKVQHGGIIFSTEAPDGQSSLHLWQGMAPYDIGQQGRAIITQPVLAVTAACMVIRRSLFKGIGGFDAEKFPVDYNDVDLCIRLRKAGYRNIVCAQSMLKHDAGSTKRKTNGWNRGDLLAAEATLIAKHIDVVDPYINPNLTFDPHMRRLTAHPNSKPWKEITRSRRLLINATDNQIEQAWQDDSLPYVARLEGHFLVFDKPSMPNVRPIDLRGPIDWLAYTLSKLCISEISFHGIGDGTLGAVGFFAAMADQGWRIVSTEGIEEGNERNYYDPAGWHATWRRLVDKQVEIHEPAL